MGEREEKVNKNFMDSKKMLDENAAKRTEEECICPKLGKLLNFIARTKKTL